MKDEHDLDPDLEPDPHPKVRTQIRGSVSRIKSDESETMLLCLTLRRAGFLGTLCEEDIMHLKSLLPSPSLI
jgi:hypothetical protein